MFELFDGKLFVGGEYSSVDFEYFCFALYLQDVVYDYFVEIETDH